MGQNATSGRNCEVIIALGSNSKGAWGQPRVILAHTIDELQRFGVTTLRASGLYATEAIGGGRQPQFLNAVIVVSTSLPPSRLLHTLKRLEWAAGRRSGRRWGPRALDLDLIDYCRVRLNVSARNSSQRFLVLPHPHSDRRAFVLRPLLDVVPGWRHPVSGRSGLELLRATGRQAAAVRRIMGHEWANIP